MKSQACVIEPAAAPSSATTRSAAAAASRSTSTARGWPTTSSQTVIGPPRAVRRRSSCSSSRAGPVSAAARRRARRARTPAVAVLVGRATGRRLGGWSGRRGRPVAGAGRAGSRRASAGSGGRLGCAGSGGGARHWPRPDASARRRTLRGEPGGQPLADRGPHDGGHRFRVPARVDHQVAVRRRVGQRPERPPHPLVEVDRLPLQPVGAAPAGPGPRQPDLRVDVEQHGQVGAQPARSPTGTAAGCRRRTARGRLPGRPASESTYRSVITTSPAVQRGPDHRVHVVRAVGGEEQRLRARGQRAVRRSRAGCCAPWRRSPSRRARG